MSGAKDPLRYFRIEAREISDELGRTVLQLEKAPDPDLVARLLRLAHTLKGAAAVVKQRAIAERTHALEGVLAPLRDREAVLEKERLEQILAHTDAISALVTALVPRDDGGAARRQPADFDGSSNVLGADTGEVDVLLETISEASVQVRGLRQAILLGGQARRLADRLVDWTAPARNVPQAGVDSTKAHFLSEELRSTVTKLEQLLKRSVDVAERELQQARTAAERLRLLPCSIVLSSLERAARDTAHSLGKQVLFEAKGSDVRLDANVLGPVQRALLQLVRNAVVHGIESEAERVKAGKPLAGRVEIEVVRKGNRVAFVCRDDGGGIDLEAVRRAARKQGFQASGQDQLLHLLLKGGLTTVDQVTEWSGRGIGLDVVREAAARLGGDLTARTQPGLETSFELIVPISLLSLDALLVEVDGAVSAIPLAAVRGTARLAAKEITRTADGDSVAYDGKIVAFAPLARSLKRHATSERFTGTKTAVMVGGAAGIAAIGVDRLLGAANIVVHPLPALAFAEKMVAGVSLDAEGMPRLILDPEGLVAATLHAKGSALISDVRPPAPILVIDDSLTTRMLEQSILESAGFEVDLATSAEEGLEKARQRRYGLFLVDVEMPGMDGFAFVETIRADPGLHEIPAILVTSRGSPEDQLRGIAAGARAYVVKGEFDQVQVLATIRRLLAQT